MNTNVLIRFKNILLTWIQVGKKKAFVTLPPPLISFRRKQENPGRVGHRQHPASETARDARHRIWAVFRKFIRSGDLSFVIFSLGGRQRKVSFSKSGKPSFFALALGGNQLKISVILVLFVSFALSAQDLKKDFEKINQAYKKAGKWSVKVAYRLYPTYTSDSIAEEKTGVVYKKGDSQYNKLGSFETLYTPDHFIVADAAEKRMVLNKPVKTPEAPLAAIDLDKLMTFYQEVSYSERGKNQKVYRISLKKEFPSEFGSMELVMNAATGFVDKITLYYRQVAKRADGKYAGRLPRLEITFSEMNTRPSFGNDVFSESHYITKVGGRWQPGAAYKNYEFINQHYSTP